MSKVTTVEEMEAAFGPAEDAHMDTPLDALQRGAEGLVEDVPTRFDRMGRIIDDPNRSLVNKGVGVVAQMAGVPLDVVGGVAGTALDVLVPGTPVGDAFEWLMETETGQEYTKRYNELPQETKDDLSSMGILLESFGGFKAFKRAFNPTGRNSSTQVTDFYQDNPVLKTKGVIQSFGQRGISRAVKEATTAEGQAMLRNGIPRGTVDEVSQLIFAASNIKKIKKKVAAGERLTGEEWVALRRAKDIGGRKELASAASLLAYAEAEVIAHWNILRQMGIESPILHALAVAPNSSYVGNLTDTVDIKKSMGDIPSSVADRAIAHVTATHTSTKPTSFLQKMNPFRQKTPEKTTVVMRNTTGASNLANESIGTFGSTPGGRLYTAFNDYKREKPTDLAKDIKSVDKKINTVEKNISKRGDKGATKADQAKLDALRIEQSDLQLRKSAGEALDEGTATIGRMTTLFGDAGRFPSNKEAVDYLRASGLESLKDTALFTKLQMRKRAGGEGVLEPTELTAYKGLLTKEEGLQKNNQNLGVEDSKKLQDYRERMQTGRLSAKNEKDLARINQELDGGGRKGFGPAAKPRNVTITGAKNAEGKADLDADGYPIPDEDGFYYFSASHRSSAKELGGVNDFIAFNPKTGDTYVVISDKHDIFGLDPVGGTALVTIVEPMHWNAYDKDKAGRVSHKGAPPMLTPDQAIAKAQELTGVTPSGTGLTSMINDVMTQYKPQVTPMDKVNAVKNRAALAGGAGLMAPLMYNNPQREEQQQ